MADDLFKKSDVYELKDKDFSDEHLTHQNFRGKKGFVVFYAPWCPNCQNKVEFWKLLGHNYNVGKFSDKPLRIGAVNTEDPLTRDISAKMKITAIPAFFHVQKNGLLTPYQGQGYSPEDLLLELMRQ